MKGTLRGYPQLPDLNNWDSVIAVRLLDVLMRR